MKRFLRRYYAFIIAAAVLVPHAHLFDFVTDDAYISFRYARNLALSGELVFNLGERVEGYTNFLWTVVLALGIKLGVGPVALSRFLGVALGVGTLAVVVRMSLRLAGEQRSRWHLVAPLLAREHGRLCLLVQRRSRNPAFHFSRHAGLRSRAGRGHHGQGLRQRRGLRLCRHDPARGRDVLRSGRRCFAS
jgi:hypothetical protein